MRYVIGIVILGFALASCDGGGPKLDETEVSTWETIRDRILVPNCTEACHTSGTPLAIQSGLILTADVAYDQLVGAPAKNPAAKNEGALRVHPTAATDLHGSFLWEKINAPEQDHFFEEHPNRGAIMPLGGDPLSFGELAYIRRWLLAGAPETGVVADPIVLEDTSLYRADFFEPLPLMAPTEGLSMRLGPFAVPANFEREFFYREPVETPQDLLVDRVTISMQTGSHHFIIYTYPDGTPASRIPLAGLIRDLRSENGVLNSNVLRQMQYQVFLSGTQWPKMDYQFPPGVALRVPAGSAFDLNSHYVNRTDETREGEIHVNLRYANPALIQHTAEVLNLNNTDLVLPPKQVTTVTRTYSSDERINVFQLFSHAHQFMIEFRVELDGGPRDGEVVYRANDWKHPPILEIDPPLVVEPGDGLRLVATYNNSTDRTLTFGFLSEDEMMILFGYYYAD
jgi:copper type II ascorbate-dependent monooxygenase-like protein